MFRNFIAVITAFVISFVVLVSPVRAESVPINIINQSNSNMINHDQILNDDDIWSRLSRVEKTVDTVENIATIITVGGIIICVTGDLAGTAVFPPAAVLLPYCPAIGAVGGSSAISKGVKPAKYLLRSAF